MKFTIDLDGVANTISKRSFKFEEVKDHFVKVAFDIYRKKEGSFEELWQIQNADDGTPYIVALYEDDDKVVTANIANKWSVLVRESNLHIYYGQDPICKIAANQLGFKQNDLDLVQQYLPGKLAENKNLVKSLLKQVDQESMQRLLSKYPELN